MIRKGVIECAYKDLEINSNILLENVTITKDNKVRGTFTNKDGFNQWVYIRFTKDFEIALVQYYDDARTVLKDTEIYRWDIYGRCYCKAEYA